MGDDLRERLRKGVAAYELHKAVDAVKESAANLKRLEAEGRELDRQVAGIELVKVRRGIKDKRKEHRGAPELQCMIDDIEGQADEAERKLKSAH